MAESTRCFTGSMCYQVIGKYERQVLPGYLVDKCYGLFGG